VGMPLLLFLITKLQELACQQAGNPIMTRFPTFNFGFLDMGIWSLFEICDWVIINLKAWIKIPRKW